MKPYLLLFASLLLWTGANANCTNAYASAGYSLAHAKRSLSANNFDHQQYYAGRSLEAFEKAKLLVETCGCQSSMDPILNGIDNLTNALGQTEWDMGRYYTKKALENAHQLLESLDICSSGAAGSSTTGNSETEAVQQEEAFPLDTPKPEATYEVQLLFQQQAEGNITELEKAIHELATLFQCDKALHILKERKSRTEAALSAETLETTKAYYLSQVVSIHNKALFALLECSKNTQ